MKIMECDSDESVEYFKEYYDNDFFKNFKSVNEDDVLFIIGKNIDKTKFLVMIDNYSDNSSLEEYIGVWNICGVPSKNMAAKIKRLDERHDIIYALHKQNPKIPVRMNPFAPTNRSDFKILVRCMHLSWAYYISTVKSFHGNKVFIVNYVDNECPLFIFENRCTFAGREKPRGARYFEGCKNCNSTSIEEGCSEVKEWFEKTFEGLLENNERYPIFECSSKCSCFNKKSICKNRVSYLNRDKIPLVIFRTIDKGWALGAGKDMKAGELVTEYAGVIFEDVQISKTTDDTYMFDMDYMRAKLESKYGSNLRKSKRYYIIDSKQIGNESRFANHSCDPNMQIVVSYGVYKSPTIHKIFYCMKNNVPKGTELTVKYYHNFIPNTNSNDTVRCKCGSSNCMVVLPIKQKGKN